MKFFGLFISLILLIATSAAGQQPTPEMNPSELNNSQSPPEKPNSLTICAGNVPPEGMVVTATSTSPTCAGACRGRTVEPVEGPVMVICADQPIPQYYETESTTTIAACNCIAEEDNAYVIRRANGAPTPTPAAPTLPTSPTFH
jgi:hypothetical protein